MLTQVNAGQRAVSKGCKTVMGIGFGGFSHVAKIAAVHSRMANIDCGHSSDRSSALSFFF
jgi:hypothetical protein